VADNYIFHFCLIGPLNGCVCVRVRVCVRVSVCLTGLLLQNMSVRLEMSK